jgi:hypothetical protein
LSNEGYKHGGFRQKYNLEKVNGHPIDPMAKYFVLRYDAEGDPHARVALEAYARSVVVDNYTLANDILKELEDVNFQIKNKQKTGGETQQ